MPGRLVFSTTADGASIPTERLTIDSSGNINIDSGTVYVDAVNNRFGIGTQSPATRLHTVGDGAFGTAASSTANGIYLGGTSIYYGAALIGSSGSYAPTGKLSIQIPTHGYGTNYGLTEQMVIEVIAADTKAGRITMLPFGGNVGIGTTNPSYKLHVNGDSYGSNFVASKGTIYQASYNADSTWQAGWQTIIANGALQSGYTYLVSVYWANNGPPYPPWLLETAFIFNPTYTNGGDGLNDTIFTPLISTHISGNYSISFRARTPTQSTAGLAANLSWNPGSSSTFIVKVNLLAI
jgi:hypothetical protein